MLRHMVMRSPCAGAALDPPLWKVPKKARAREGAISERDGLSLVGS